VLDESVKQVAQIDTLCTLTNIIVMCNKFNILINSGHKCDNIFITFVFSSKAIKQCYDITTIYMYHFFENT